MNAAEDWLKAAIEKDLMRIVEEVPADAVYSELDDLRNVCRRYDLDFSVLLQQYIEPSKLAHIIITIMDRLALSDGHTSATQATASPRSEFRRP